MNNITKKELRLLGSCQSGECWSEAVGLIKKARDGDYPSDWWATVKLSGLMDKVMSRWGDSSDLRVSSFNTKSELLEHLGINER